MSPHEFFCKQCFKAKTIGCLINSISEIKPSPLDDDTERFIFDSNYLSTESVVESFNS